MELMEKRGYKQTEVGLIPVDWEIESFGEVADKRIKNSITGGPFGSNLKTEDYTSDGVQIIQLQNIGDGQFIDNSVVYTSEKKADELNSCNIYPGEIILSKMGDPVARACMMPFKAKRYLMASDGIRFVVDEKKYSKAFVFNYINSKYFRNRAIDISTGSTRQRIGLPDLKGLLFIKPPLTEQKAIATALSDVDDLIANLDKLITKKKAIKQGAMQQLLTPPSKGGKRLAGFTGEWVEKKLGELFEITSSKRVFQSDWKDKGVPFYRARELAVLSKTGKVDNDLFIEESMYNSYKLKYGAPEKGDLLVTGVGTLGKVYLVKDNTPFYFKDGNIIWFKINNSISSELLMQLYFTPQIISQIENSSSGTTVGTYTITSAKSTVVNIPIDLKEQNAIAVILSDIDKEIEQLETKKAKYQDIKQGMMQELLTGKTRLI